MPTFSFISRHPGVMWVLVIPVPQGLWRAVSFVVPPGIELSLARQCLSCHSRSGITRTNRSSSSSIRRHVASEIKACEPHLRLICKFSFSCDICGLYSGLFIFLCYSYHSFSYIPYFQQTKCTNYNTIKYIIKHTCTCQLVHVSATRCHLNGVY